MYKRQPVTWLEGWPDGEGFTVWFSSFLWVSVWDKVVAPIQSLRQWGSRKGTASPFSLRLGVDTVSGSEGERLHQPGVLVWLQCPGQSLDVTGQANLLMLYWLILVRVRDGSIPWCYRSGQSLGVTGQISLLVL